MHLLSVISPLADDLALVYPPLMPVRLVQLLAERGIETVEVPDEEYETLGCNALALAPRVALIAGAATPRRGGGSRRPASRCSSTRRTS